MGFRDAKVQVLDCLMNGYVSHEQRNNINIKNLFATGQVSAEEVAEIIGRSRGSCYSSSRHYVAASIEVHLIKTRHGDQDWYIKWYFVEPGSVFISVPH